MTLDIRPFDAALGAEVRALDLSRDLNDATFDAIERAWNDHSVLLFRDQAIDEIRHLAFTRRFGDLEVHVLDIPTQHLAICDYALPQRRYMHRTTLRGTPPQ